MKLILACDIDGGIGLNGKLPWDNIKGDLPRFKRLTEGQVIIMGRKTWESLPTKPLPNRLNFVVSSNHIELPHGAILVNDTEHFSHFKNAWLIGGASLVESCWHLIDEIHLTKTFTKYHCDTYVNLVDLESKYTLAMSERNSDHVYQIWKKK
jgi:dihydrofolate reductase